MKNIRIGLLATVALLALSPTVQAQAAKPAAASAALSIPAGDLAGALDQFSRQTGLQVMADPALLAGKRTPGVSGTQAPQAGLRQLLSGTGLDFQLDGETVLLRAGVTVKPAAAAATSLPVQTAAASAAPAATETLEEVIVTGFKGSITRALDIKREADSIVDAISAEDIGKFPSQNIAEALQRVPGVSIVRDRGEGLFVRVRGLGANFQTTTLNGRSAAVNENVRDSGQSGRQFRFDTLPSELVSRVDVIKSPTAALDEGAIGGIVNVRTFRPLDLKDTQHAFSATASYPELADTVDARFSGLTSWRNEDRSFGVLLAAVYDQRTMRQDRALNGEWSLVRAGIDTNGDKLPDTGPIYRSASTRPTLEQEERERVGLSGAVQWSPSADININLDVAYTDLNINYDELTYSADFDWSKLVPGTAVIKDGVLVGGVVGTSTQIGREQSELAHKNLQVGLNGEYLFGDGWKLTGDLAYSRAVSDTPTPIRRSRVLGPVGNVAFEYFPAGDKLHNLSFLTANLNSPSTLPGRRLEWRVNDSLDTEKAAQIDLEKQVEWGPISALQAGVKYRDRLRDYNRRDLTITRDRNGKSITGTFYGAEYYETGFLVDDFLGESGGTLPTTWVVPNGDKFFELMDPTLINQPLARADLRNSYKITETIKSAYLLADLDSALGDMPLRGNVGVRVAQTNQVSSGHADDGKKAEPVRFEKDYTDVLPSANLALDISDDLVSRLSVAKVITRPSLADLAPRLTLNSSGTILTAVGGNPRLEPFEAWQYDATLEWYFAPSSALIAGLFYKDIGTFMTTRKSTLVVDGVNYELSARVNGGDASIKGAELAYQQTFDMLPEPFDGLGLLANYTYTDTRATYFDGTRTIKDDLENVAKHSVNLTGFYEKGPIGLRLSYSWRGDVLAQVGTNGLESANDKAFGSLDANITYQLTDNLTLVAEAINLTDEAQWQFVADDLFSRYDYYGRTFTLGLRAKF
ncbi:MULTISPECIES: TonB-dependent receptor [unclassified Azospirillum]|uniref:TonB-dependent receptor n=1 Tax=unclassified Azospirillum TaxID=2630922 RepID=UPI000B707188|nr:MULTISPECIES: TonB-dependent receptor [unclassified Azospirillum]SNS72061.1 TonB-dependent receptor [Azospirillum sp. RU38E]SNS90017.1 TonB-dependent receptor [Azospirillum sp. RU37A]